jgi:diguanylate cyclase (GGDEF)-like protein
MTLLPRLIGESIKDERELFNFVVSVTALCVALALAVDVTNQLVFFVDWATCLRSWSITTVLVLALAIPISRTIGKAHLKLHRAKLVVEALSRTDQLTGLPNRRALMEAVAAAKSAALALVIVDIDRFKRINDAHGHLAGDEVIKSVARRMSDDLSGLGALARVGGEEFALLSPGASQELLNFRLTAFRERVSATPIMVNGLAVRVTISAGVAVSRDGETFDQLYLAADRALYAAKSAGRNRVLFADSIDARRADGAAADAERISRSA